MKRNLAIAIAFLAGALFGGVFPRPSPARAQNQPYKYVSPQEAKNIEDWVKARDEKLAAERAQNKLDLRSAEIATEAQEMLDKDLKKLESAPEQDRQNLMRKIELETKIAEDARKSSMEVRIVDIASPFTSAHVPFSEAAGMSCFVSEKQTTRCFVLGRR